MRRSNLRNDPNVCAPNVYAPNVYSPNVYSPRPTHAPVVALVASIGCILHWLHSSHSQLLVSYACCATLAAAAIVTKLGGFGTYTALHVRRNELQYKEVFISADQVRCSLVQIR
jgi:hypothetical protein